MGEKSIAKNAAFNVIYKVLNMFFPLITTVYISHILSASGVGKVSIAQNAAQYFVLMAPLGIVNYGTREIAKIRDNKEHSNIVFSELFLINTISTILCSMVYYIMIFSESYFENERILFVIAGLPIVFNIFNVDWYYQGQEEYVYISIRNIAVKIASIILMLFFVRTKDDYIVYAIIYVGGIVGNYIFNIVNLVFKNKVRLHLNNLNFKRHFKPVFVLFASALAIELYTLLDTTMLGYFCEDSIVGYYNNAMKLDRTVVGLISAIGAVLLPRFSYYIKNGNINECNKLLSKIVRIMVFLAIPCGIGIFVLADKFVVVLFGSTFEPAITTVRIGTLLVYVLAFSNLFGTQILLSFNQERKLLVCTIVGAITNFTINMLLIPRFMHNGAIVASVISEVIVATMSIIMAMKYVSIELDFRFCVVTIVAGLLMGISVYLSTILFDNDFLCMIGGIAIGMIVYFTVNLIFKNPIIKEGKDLFSKR